MKKLILLLFFGFIFTLVKAQDPQLLDNTWFLEKLEIQDIEYLPPLDNCSNIGEIAFDSNNLLITHLCCNTECIASISYDSFDVFNLIEKLGCLLDTGCPPEVWNYTELHLGIYFDENQNPINSYNYIVNSLGDYLQLIVANGDGDIAIYNNVLLNTSSFETQEVSIYPNPVAETLFIQTNESIKHWTIYNLQGQMILEGEKGVRSIEVSSLPQGVYFLELQVGEERLVKQFVKE